MIQKAGQGYSNVQLRSELDELQAMIDTILLRKKQIGRMTEGPNPDLSPQEISTVNSYRKEMRQLREEVNRRLDLINETHGEAIAQLN